MNHMQRSLPVSVAILLAACGVAATTSNDAAESATQKSGKAKQRARVGFESFDRGGMAGCFDPNLSGHARAAAERIGGVPCAEAPATTAAGSDSWIGEYEGPAVEGMTAGVSIRRGVAPNRYQVRVEVGGPGCGGQVEGMGIAANNRMTVIVPVSEGSGQCRVQLDRNGSTLSMDESDDCLGMHGAQCRFEARVTRQGPARAAVMPTRPMPVSGNAWIVGAWIARGGPCGEGVTYSANGTYITDIQTGRWQLNGNTLIETALTNDEEGGVVRNPQPGRSQILSVAANRNAFVVRYPDGEVYDMVRCR
jgi:hypothetical protein